MHYKEILSAIAIALTFAAFVPYLCTIIRGTTKPHIFSWVIWGATTFVIFLAQLEGMAGWVRGPLEFQESSRYELHSWLT